LEIDKLKELYRINRILLIDKMKVKKNKILFFLLAIFALVLLFIIIYLPVKQILNLINKDNNFTTVGFPGEIIDEDALEKYYTQNQIKVDVLHYNLELDLYPENELLKGITTITAVIKDQNISSIDFNFYDNLDIRLITINQEEVSFHREETTLILPAKKVNSDTVSVKIYYEGSPKSLGFGSFEFGQINDVPVVYTLSEPIYASTWFPCNDMPSDKSRADIFITNDTSSVSVSNGKLIDASINGNRKTYHWQISYPIATYLIAFCSGPYKHFNDQIVFSDSLKMNLEYYVFPNHYYDAKKDFTINKSAIKCFSNLFGEYPFAKEKYGVVEFLWQLGAMEHQTITGIGTNFITGKGFFNDLLIHEVAHQWWGNAVTPKSWKDVWLNEGFATYSEALYWENQSGKSALRSTMIAKKRNLTDGTVYNPGAYLFSDLIYNKGAWTLHMLRKEVGSELFFKILREYFFEYKYGNSSTKDFQNTAEKLSGKKLDKFFDQWIYNGEGIINISYNFLSKKVENKWKTKLFLSQDQHGYDIYHFPIDTRINFKNSSFVDSVFYIFSKDTIINLITETEISDLEFDRENWLLAEINMEK
jgi:aminopeptidase N